MTAVIKRTVPWGDGHLSPGDPVPPDVPPGVVAAWLRTGKAEQSKPKSAEKNAG